MNIFKTYLFMLLSVLLLTTACDPQDTFTTEDIITPDDGDGVLILCEGNYNSGNASLSYYNPTTHAVENGVFRRVNDRRLGDTGQSITIDGNTAYIAVENSGIVWAIDTRTFKVKGQLTASANTQIINPRYVLKIDDTKAYVTDLYAHYVNMFNPQTMEYKGNISVEQAANLGYCSTEEMVRYGNYVYTNCWSYSNKILVIDINKEQVVDSIVLSSWQPKSIRIDCNGKLWAITDGGYSANGETFGNNIPHLYRIDAKSKNVELDITLKTDEANVQIETNKAGNTLYIVNNDVYRMDVTANSMPAEPFIKAPVDDNGTRHKLYGIGINPNNEEIYVADAVDYSQSGMVYRYDAKGTLIDKFRVGITPNHFAFIKGSTSDIPKDEKEEENEDDHSLVNKVYEFMPAPGHQVNGYSVVGDFIHEGATMEEACEVALEHFKKQWMVSLGAQGGYIIAGFDHNVINSNGDYDLVIRGNPYSYQSEPGIIWVSMDENGDGLPNDTWYELAGSEYGTENETLDYAITYYKPTTPKTDIRWKDNQGNEGIVPHMDYWNSHDYYWQDWVPTETTPEGECRTYYGSRLKDTHTYSNGYTMEYPFDWGYADNLGSDYFRNKNKSFSSAMGYYRISNAMTHDGQPANLPYINFVKVQTAQTGYSPNLGEISTEVYGIWDYHPEMKEK